MLKPVSELGSSELENGKLKKNTDGSLTLWLAPSLPAGVPATNWLPSPPQTITIASTARIRN